MANRKEQERRKTTFKDREEKHVSGFQRATFKIPKGMQLWNPKPGTYRIDIIPFVAGDHNHIADKGFIHWECTYFVHPNIGPERTAQICSRKTLKKDCYGCDHRARLSGDPEGDEDLIKSLIPKERQLFLVIVHEERDKGIQLWDISYHMFGKKLDEKIRKADDEDKEAYENFWDLESGMTLRVTLSEKTAPGFNKPFNEVSDIEFKERKKQYDPDMVDESPCLDDLLTPLDYEDFKKAFLQVEEPEERDAKRGQADDDDDEPRRPTGKKRQQEDDDDEPAPDEEEDDEPKKPSGKKAPKDEEDEPEVADDEPADEDDEPKKPAAKKGGLSIGSRVTFEDPKSGKEKEGEIVAINKGEKNCTIKDDDGKRYVGVDLIEVDVIAEKEEEEDDDDIPQRGKPSSKSGTKKPSPKDEEDDEPADDDDPVIEKGDVVQFEWKGKTLKGDVIKIDRDDDTVLVHGWNQPKAVQVDLSDCKFIRKKKKDDDE